MTRKKEKGGQCPYLPQLIDFFGIFQYSSESVNMYTYFFDNFSIECKVVSTPGHCEKVIEAVERIKKNLK